jgi:transcriptional regulator with XRE-family HTH domain
MTSTPADLVRTARNRGGLTQRELARRANTVQSVVARIEQGVTSPTWETLRRLIAAAGFQLEALLGVPPAETSHMLGDVSRILRLTPEERLLELRNASRLLVEAQRRA